MAFETPADVASIYSNPNSLIPMMDKEAANAAQACLRNFGYVMIAGVRVTGDETVRSAIAVGELGEATRTDRSLIGPYLITEKDGSSAYHPGIGVWHQPPQA